MSLARWHDLTPQQQAHFGNGCGPAWLPDVLTTFIFSWFFTASCRRHDFAYTRGGHEAARKMADMGFLKAMLADVAMAAVVYRPFLWLLAWVFYALVHVFGKHRFNYGEPLRLANILFHDSHRGVAENNT